jgi:hypothetical protein
MIPSSAYLPRADPINDGVIRIVVLLNAAHRQAEKISQGDPDLPVSQLCKGGHKSRQHFLLPAPHSN